MLDPKDILRPALTGIMSFGLTSLTLPLGVSILQLEEVRFFMINVDLSLEYN